MKVWKGFQIPWGICCNLNICICWAAAGWPSPENTWKYNNAWMLRSASCLQAGRQQSLEKLNLLVTNWKELPSDVVCISRLEVPRSGGPLLELGSAATVAWLSDKFEGIVVPWIREIVMFSWFSRTVNSVDTGQSWGYWHLEYSTYRQQSWTWTIWKF